MSDASSQVERMLNLAAYLFSRRAPASFDEIVSVVKGYDDGAPRPTLVKRFKRDRAALRASGVDVVFEEGCVGPAGYRAAREEGTSNGVRFSGPETAVLMAVGAAAEAAFGAGPLTEALRSALRKLAPFASADSASPPPSRKLRRAVEHEDQADALAAAAEACAEKRRLKFDYRGARDAAPVARTVSVFAVVRGPVDWTVVGHDHERNAVRSFRLARMSRKPRVLRGAKALEPPDGFQARSPRFEGRVDRARVSLRSIDGRDEGLEAVAPPGVAWSASGRGEGFVEVAPTEDRALIGRVLSAAGTVVIEGPVATREAAKAAALGLLKAHRGKAVR